MSADEATQEPTMEEILASIRRIISEDDEAAVSEGDAGDEVMEAASEDEDVLDLAEPVEDAAEAEVEEFDQDGIDDVFEQDAAAMDDDEIIAIDTDEDFASFDEMEEEAEAVDEVVEDDIVIADEIAEEVTENISFDDEEDALVEQAAATNAAGALGKLVGAMSMGNGITLEAIVREMLRPMLKEWLNDNLPRIVEEKVQEEVKRISRMAR